MRSFIPVASASDFPIQNLPYCAFRRRDEEHPQIGARIGDFLLDLKALEHEGHFLDTPLGETHVFCKRALNKFMAQGTAAWSAARARIQSLLTEENPTLRDNAGLRARALLPVSDAQLCMPVEIGDYTDFYSSRHHAFNVGAMFRGPQNALMENYLWIPIGYHGRAGSIVLSGADVRRPVGQTKLDSDPAPTFGASRSLDFELEMGFFIGPGNKQGEPIPIERADEHIFGLVIVNDWSARDIQRWEYQPLGPFLAKNFATTISPYVVPMAALAPFRICGGPQDPPPLPYLKTPSGHEHAWLNIELEVALQTEKMAAPQVISRSNCRHLYWSMAQQLTHHASGGCNLRPGDLMASGTISGPTPDSYGSMLELAWRGERPLNLASGEERKFLQDGDSVILRAWAQGDGYRVGFGECRGRITAARL